MNRDKYAYMGLWVKYALRSKTDSVFLSTLQQTALLLKKFHLRSKGKIDSNCQALDTKLGPRWFAWCIFRMVRHAQHRYEIKMGSVSLSMQWAVLSCFYDWAQAKVLYVLDWFHIRLCIYQIQATAVWFDPSNVIFLQIIVTSSTIHWLCCLSAFMLYQQCFWLATAMRRVMNSPILILPIPCTALHGEFSIQWLWLGERARLQGVRRGISSVRRQKVTGLM